MRARIRKSGNSALVYIPSPVIAAAALNIGQAVDVREENGRIVIEPAPAATYDLDALLDRMTPATFPDESDFDPRMGKEMW